MATGYLPEYLYGLGRLETDGLSFPELEKRAHINARAQAAGDGEDFSRLIRETGSFTPVCTKPAP